MKKNNNKGFTLMEMLIVVAIIAILVAIAIPTFAGQLDKARLAADEANIRSAYAQAMTNALMDAKGSGSASTQKMQTSGSNVAIGGTTVSWSSGQIITWTVSDGVANYG